MYFLYGVSFKGGSIYYMYMYIVFTMYKRTFVLIGSLMYFLYGVSFKGGSIYYMYMYIVFTMYKRTYICSYIAMYSTTMYM